MRRKLSSFQHSLWLAAGPRPTHLEQKAGLQVAVVEAHDGFLHGGSWTLWESCSVLVW
jgi:hypothetical protein